MRDLGQNMHYLSSLVKVCPKEVNDSLKVINKISLMGIYKSCLSIRPLIRDVIGILLKLN